MTKVSEKALACSLRAQGFSIKDICKTLNVSQSSVSLWVRDVRLTEVQIQKLAERNPCYNSKYRGQNGTLNRERYKKLRADYQEQGRQSAKIKNWLHIAGCMLYWAEGAKRRNSIELGNSDPILLKFFLRFLRESLNVNENEISVSINCYPDCDVKIVENFWLKELNLPESCLRKTQVDCRPRSSKHRGAARRLENGVCKIMVHNTRLVNEVYGAIQEYAGFERPEWLF